MRKSFTRFLSLLFVFCLVAGAFSKVSAQKNPAQETVKLFASKTSACYGESNKYSVTVSVQDFNKLSAFNLELKYSGSVFSYVGSAPLTGWTATSSITVDGSTDGKVILKWDGSETALGIPSAVDIIRLDFALDNGVAPSTVQGFTWTNTTFKYNADQAFTGTTSDGSLTITQSYPEIVTSLTSETCSGGPVTLKVTSPLNVNYSFGNLGFSSNNEYTATPGTTVQVKVKKDGCISYVKNVDIPTAIEPVKFTVSKSDPACYGSDASVAVNATGGTATYTYYYNTSASTSGATVRTSSQFSLPTSTTATDYYIAVQDSKGCVTLSDAATWTKVTVQDNNKLVTLSYSVNKTVTCNGGNDGEAKVTVSDPSVYYVALDGGTWTKTAADGTKLFTSLVAGTHTVTAKTLSDCTISSVAVFKVTQPDAMKIVGLSITDTSCGKQNTGEVSLTVSGGTAPYDFKLSGGGDTFTTTVNSTYVFTGLKPIYYSFTATDVNKCSVSYVNPNKTGNVIAVQSPKDINFVPTPSPVLCFGGTGTITVGTVTGGSGSYAYSIDGGINTQTSTTFSNLVAGTYTVTVANSAGFTCAVPMSVKIDSPSKALTASITTTTAPICADGTDGDVTLKIEGGTSPWYYSVNGGKAVTTTSTYSHIAASVGTMTITVVDNNGCKIEAPLTSVITQGTNSITASSDHVIKCNGKVDGTITVSKVTWAGANEVPSRVVTYKYVTKETDVYTAAAKTLIPTGTQSATTLGAGDYWVYGVDNFGCTSKSVKVTIAQNGPVEFVGTPVTHIQTCYNTYDGNISFEAKGGSASGTDTVLEYAIVNDNITTIPGSSWKQMTYKASTKTYTADVQMTKGKYKISVKDPNCGEVAYPTVIEVGGYDQLLIDETKVTSANPDCNGYKTGTVTVPVASVTGGLAPYKYTLLKGGVAVDTYTQVDSGLFTGLATGTYTVKVEDATKCPSYTTSKTILIEEPGKLVASVTKTDITCNGANDGIITISVTGGTYSPTVTTAQYAYAINNSESWVPFVGTSKTYIATQAGKFNIWVKDLNAKACYTITPTTVEISEPSSISATVTVTKRPTNCTDAEVKVTATGGGIATETITYTYKFDGVTVTSTTATSTTFTVAKEKVGTHSVTVSVNNSCPKVVNFDIIPIDPITYDVKVSNAICKGESNGTITVTVLGGGTASSTSGYQVQLTGPANYDSGYVWTGSDKVSVFNNLPSGTYTVRIKDANGCELAASVNDNASPYTTVESFLVRDPLTALSVSGKLIANAKCSTGEGGSFSITAAGGEQGYKFYTVISEVEQQHLLKTAPAKDSNEWIPVTQGNTYTKTTAGAGTWIVWAQDANGCIVGGEQDKNGNVVNEWRVKVASPAPITFALGSTTTPTCNGKSDGSIAVNNIVGGTPTYTVTVKGTGTLNQNVDKSVTTTGSSATISGLPASSGYYSITVSDANLCMAASTLTKTIGEPEALTVSLTVSEGSFTCPGSVEGWIEAKANGGTAGYKYRLFKDNTLFVNWTNVSAFIVQVGHLYKVESVDKDGSGTCTATAEVFIKEPLPVEASIKETTCYGDAKASIKIRATGEAGRTFSVRYRLNGGSYPASYTAMPNGELAVGDLLFSNVSAGQNFYYFEIVDNKGCKTELVDKSFVPTQHPLQVTATVVDMKASVVITGGISPYTYSVGTSTVTLDTNGDTFQTVNLPAGQNTITVYDAHGCSYKVAAEIAPLAVTAEPATGSAMKNSFDVKLTFNRDVTGVASATTVAGGTISSVTGTGKVYTVTLVGADLATVTLTVGNAVKDAAGSTLSPSAVFTYVVGDNTAPLAASYSPNAVTTENTHPALVVTFNENVAVGTGNVKIIKKSDGATVVTIPASAISVSGKTATLTYAGGLDKDVDYYVTIESGVVKDLAGNAFAGVTASSTWTFKTGPVYPTPVPEPVNSLEFKVYPNPFVSEVTIDNIEQLSKVVISNIAGQVVKIVVNPSNPVDGLNELRSGVYFISLYQDGKVVSTVKLLKR